MNCINLTDRLSLLQTKLSELRKLSPTDSLEHLNLRDLGIHPHQGNMPSCPHYDPIYDGPRQCWILGIINEIRRVKKNF